MKRKSLADMCCSIARTLDIVGEWWTILILRDACFGVRRFADFRANLGIAGNILSARLETLCRQGILTRVPIKDGAKRCEYRLTEKGEALFPVLLALMHWGDRWADDGKGAPLCYVERASRRPVAESTVRSASGAALRLDDLMPVPGPGASAEIKRLFGG